MLAVNSAVFRAKDADKLFPGKLSVQIKLSVSFFSNSITMKNCSIVHSKSTIKIA